MTKKELKNQIRASKMRIEICQTNYDEFEEILGKEGVRAFIDHELDFMNFYNKRLERLENKSDNEKK